MANSYQKLFRLRIRHSYYNNGYSNDFSIVPLPQTQKLSKQYKLLFREVDNGLDVLSLMTEENTPLLDLGGNNKLSFALILKNPDLLNFTSLPKKQNSRQIYQMENAPEVGTSITTSEWNLIEPRPNNFTYTRRSEANEIVLKTTNPFGDSDSGNMTKTGNKFSRFFALDGLTEGKYTLETTEDGERKEDYHFYASEALWKTRPFAIIDFFTSELDYNKVKTYSIRLGSKKATWTYRVNLSKDYTGSTISVEDSRESPKVLFKIIGNTNQAMGKIMTFRSYMVNRPKSKARLRFKETPLSDFNLIIEKNGTKTEIKGLPNPAVDQVKTEMHINI